MYFKHLAYCVAPGKDLLNERPNYGYDFFFCYDFLASLWQACDWDPLKAWGLGKESLYFKPEEDNEIRGEGSCVYQGKMETKLRGYFLIPIGMTL